jgi:methylisocitrate lyase
MSLSSGASNLRKTLEDPNGFVCAPGVYDGLSARMALAADFDALYMVSSRTPNPLLFQANS